MCDKKKWLLGAFWIEHDVYLDMFIPLVLIVVADIVKGFVIDKKQFNLTPSTVFLVEGAERSSRFCFCFVFLDQNLDDYEQFHTTTTGYLTTGTTTGGSVTC